MVTAIALGVMLLPHLAQSLEQRPAHVPFAKQPGIAFDPKNGYFDYLLAADIVAAAKQPNSLTTVPSGLDSESALTKSRKIRAEFGIIYDHIARGNKKGSWFPYSKVSLDSQHGEISAFRSLGKVFAAMVYVYMAEGDSAKAANVLREAFIFSDNVGRGTFLHLISQQIFFGPIVEVADDITLAMPEQEGLALAASLSAILNKEPALLTALKIEVEVLKSVSLATIEDSGGYNLVKAMFFFSTTEEQIDPLVTELEGYTPAQQVEVFHQLSAMNKARIPAYQAMFLKPESEWKPIGKIQPPTNVIGLVDKASNQMNFNFFNAVVVRRTQIRILRLHLAISAFYWEHRRLPEVLDELSQKSWLEDPLTGGRFQYEVSGRKDYRLYSKGSKRGEIDLRRRPNQPSEPARNEPPLLR